MTLTDSFNRQLTYLRISVTERCNMRCSYCRPPLDERKPQRHLLTYEEIERIVRVVASLGVSKIRMTGGEPLARRDIPHLIERLSTISGITDLAMTTNASFLAHYAHPLAEAGLRRVNISIDSLNSLRFRKLTGAELSPVLAGIRAACDAGLTPIKLNTVVMRGVNDDEIGTLIDFATQHHATIRFIELMPMQHGLNWKKHYIPTDELLQYNDVQRRVDVDAPLVAGKRAARYFPLRNSLGRIGFIMPMSEGFCEGCNRLRLTAEGGLRSCLPADENFNIRNLMRSGCSDDALRLLFIRLAHIKPEMGIYHFHESNEKASMTPAMTYSMLQRGG